MIDNIPSPLLFEEYEFVLSALILIALISSYIFFRNWKQLRFIEDTPTAKLRSAHQGYIELEGKGIRFTINLFMLRYLTTNASGIIALSNTGKLFYIRVVHKRDGRSFIKM